MALYSDNFNRANEALEVPATWSKRKGQFNIVSNQVDLATSVLALYTWEGGSVGADQYVEVALKNPNTAGGSTRPVALRLTDLGGGEWGGYIAYRQWSSISANRFFSIYRIETSGTGFTQTLLVKSATGQANAADGDIIRLEAEGTALRIYLNGALITSTTDATYSSGKLGLSDFNGSTIQHKFDDWAGGDLGLLDGTGGIIGAGAALAGAGYMFTPHVDGRQAIAVNQPAFGGTDYPFINPASDIAHLIGDLYLSYRDDNGQRTLPLRVAWMYGFGLVTVTAPPGRPTPTHDHDVVIEDADGTVVFDSTTASYSKLEWADRLLTIQWVGDSGVLRLTKYLKWKSGDVPVAFKNHIEPSDGRLDGRTYEALPRRVRRLIVNNQTLPAGLIRFKDGYNTAFDTIARPRVDGGRLVNRIVAHAGPGDGLGRKPGCSDADVVIKRVNQVAPAASGDLLMDAYGCYRIQRPMTVASTSPRTVNVTGATLQVFNDCGPCCECDDFVRTYRGLRRLFFRFLALGQRAEAVRDLYSTNRDRWLGDISCRRVQPLRLVILQEFGCQVAVGGLMCNMTNCCLVPVVLRLTFQSFSGGALTALPAGQVIPCGETQRTGSDTCAKETPSVFGGTYPVLDTVFDFAEPQGTSTVRTRLISPECVSGLSLRVTLSAHYEEPPGDCTVPDTDAVDVPADIQTLWDSAAEVPPVRGLLQKDVSLLPDSPCRCS